MKAIIAQYLGDGLLVYFGWPQAHEDDAQRGVRSGLGIIEAMGTLNTRLEQEQGVRLAIRVGIHTGLVVIGEMGGGGHQERLALGGTPNVASRLQSLAEPDIVVVSEATSRLIEGYFTCQDMGEQSLKGIAEPQRVYRVVRESGAQSRLDVTAPRGLTPLVGREQEVGLLLERWEQVKDGQGQVVLLSGEGGIGKSRLVQVLKDRLAREASMRVECQCSPYYQHTAFHPVVSHFQRLLRWQREDTPEAKLNKLEKTLAPYACFQPDMVPLFASLLAISLPERYPPLNLTPQRQKQKAMEAWLTWLLARADKRTVLLIIEDLQWVDPSTLELLNLLIDQTPTASIFTMLTCRPTFQQPWSPRSYLTQLTLNRLSRHQIELMTTHVASGKSLPTEVLRQIVEKTDGVPLFVEEMTKAILESGHVKEVDGHYELTGTPRALAIPATLQDSLMARLDRLVTGKAVAQYASIIGRQFPYELLQAVSQLDEPTLLRELHRLVEAELLYQRGLPPQAMYTFKHALVQDAAYQALLKSTRQQYHQRTAQVLEERFPETVETQPELLAHHYTEAGLHEQAVNYWQRAGERAVAHSSHAEAIGHFRMGLDVLPLLPDTPARAEHELKLQRALGASLIATKGYAAPEVEPPYARARALCQQVGDTRQVFPVLFGLWGFHNVRVELQTARELAEQLLTLAEREQDPALLLQGYRTLGDTLYWLGEFRPALRHLEQGIALYDPQQHRNQALFYGQDPGQGLLVYAAAVLWMLGYPDQSRQRSEEALALARGLSHPFSLAHALSVGAGAYIFLREWRTVQERAETLIALATEQGFAQWLGSGRRYQAIVQAMQGPKREEGIAQVLDMGVGGNVRGYTLTHLAQAYGMVGQADKGLHLLGETLAWVDNEGVRYCETELYRVKGELLLQQAVQNAPQAEACFHQALNVACNQQAKSWELRAATSLARLWQSQGKRQEATELLAPVYEWFTEGFDTADLKDAKALLMELDG